MITGARQLLTDDQFEDAFDERGILRNGKAVRVSMMVMDNAQLAPAANRPDILASDNAKSPSLEQTYLDHERRLGEMWRDPSSVWRDPAPAVAPQPQQPTNDEQQPATLEDAYNKYHDWLVNAHKNPPAMAPINPDATPAAVALLPPPSTALTDERERLYAKRNEAYENAWKNPL